MLFSIFDVLRIFWGSANIILQIRLKMGKNEEDFESIIIFEAQKYIYIFLNRGLIVFFQMDVFATLFLRCQTLWKSTLKVVQFNVEIHNVFSTLSNVVNYNFDVHNVFSMLIWRCATSWRHTNLETTLSWRWHVCWE